MAGSSSGTQVPPSFTPGPNDPPALLTQPRDRDPWIALDPNRYMDMCTQSAVSGNFDYVKTGLQVAHEGMSQFILDRASTGTQEVTANEAYQMLQLQQNMNAMLLTMINRNARAESDGRRLVTRVETVEGATNTMKEIAKLTEAITKGGAAKSGPGGKPISECKALQILSRSRAIVKSSASGTKNFLTRSRRSSTITGRR